MRNRTALILSLVLITLPGCKKSGEDVLRGSYATTISHWHVPTLPEMVGPWEITFAQEGKYSVRRNGLLLIQGEYSVQGDTLRIFNETGVAACTGQPPASYHWELTQDSLFLVKALETCPGREIILTTHPLVRKR